MQVELKNPELARFIADQVQAGLFDSATAAIEAAVEQMRNKLHPLDQETVNAIQKADEQYLNGDYVEWTTVRNQMRQKYISQAS